MEPWLPLGHWGWGVLIVLALLPSAIYWRGKIWKLIPAKRISDGLPNDLIRFIDAADMVWPKTKAAIGEKLREEIEEDIPLVKHIWHEMFSGRKNSVTLYAIRPPSTKVTIIEKSYSYELNDDLLTAVDHFVRERNTIADLLVSRKDVKKWLKKYLRSGGNND